MAGLRVAMLLENDLFPQDTRVWAEAETLAEAGHSIHVIAPRGDGQPPREQIGRVSVERFALDMDHAGRPREVLAEYVRANLALHRRGLRALWRGRAEVLHLHNPPDTLFPLAAAARAAGRAVVFDQHDLFDDLVSQRVRFRGAAALAGAMRIATTACSSAVLATNESQREIALAAPGSPPIVEIVRNGPPEEWLAAEAPMRPGELTDPRLVFVGAIEEQDGVRMLPELLERLVKQHDLSAATLTLVGWGADLDPVMREFEARGLAGRVRATGRVDHAAVLSELQKADICLDPAPCTVFNNRSTMVKIGEYLALGRPTVSHPLVETERTAADAILYAPCDDVAAFAAQCARLARDEPLRRALSAAARKRAEALVWSHSAERLLTVYDALATRRRAR